MVHGANKIARRPTPTRICPARLVPLDFVKRNIKAPMTVMNPGTQKKKKAITVSSMPQPGRKTL
jgi:hypothetical protein